MKPFDSHLPYSTAVLPCPSPVRGWVVVAAVGVRAAREAVAKAAAPSCGAGAFLEVCTISSLFTPCL